MQRAGIVQLFERGGIDHLCGFVGYWSSRGDGFYAGALEDPLIDRRLSWRGPDDQGFLSRQGLAVFHRRLSIIGGRQSGSQPMFHEDGSVLAFNGEIYNYRDLARQFGLSSSAHESDTACLMELCRIQGVENATRVLEGMFSFFFVSDTGNAHLVRDPFGIKPLAYWIEDGRVIFGSDPACVCQLGRTTMGREAPYAPDQALRFLGLGATSVAQSIWQPIRKVRPGHIVTVDSTGLVASRRYYPVDEPVVAEREERLPRRDTSLEQVLMESVERHLVADVEVGAFLSAGLDSGITVALAQNVSNRPLRTFSIAMSARPDDEGRLALQVANYLGTSHEVISVDDSKFTGLIDVLVEAYPEPFADSAAAAVLLLSERAVEDVKVVLTGEGADEIFGGYSRYRLAAVSPGFLSTRRPGRKLLSSPYLRSIRESKTLVALARAGVKQQLLREALAPEFNLPFAPEAMMQGEVEGRLVTHYLEKVDRATMRYGLEARVPFLDKQVVAWAAESMPTRFQLVVRSKPELRAVAEGLLPPWVLQRRKTGLAFSLGRWAESEAGSSRIADEMGSLGRSALLSEVLNVKRLQEVYSAGALPPRLLFRLAVLLAWERRYNSNGAHV